MGSSSSADSKSSTQVGTDDEVDANCLDQMVDVEAEDLPEGDQFASPAAGSLGSLTKSFYIGRTKCTKDTLMALRKKGVLPPRAGRIDPGESTPNPRTREDVVF